MMAWLQRRLLVPLRRLLAQGVSPQQLALSVSLGIVIGNIPLFGISTVLCIAVALALRLNLAAIQLAQAAMAPTQLLLIVPFLRFGEWLTRSPPLRLSWSSGHDLLAAGPGHVLSAFGVATLQALVAWLITAPGVAALLYWALTPAFERARRQRHGRGAGPS